MPDLILHLTGPMRITDHADRPLAGVPRRGQAMLACLAVQPGMRAERGFLADLLWSDRSEDQARASLRQELSVLRRVLPGDVLFADRQAVWLESSRVSVFTGGQGEFLQGFDLASEGFEDWLRDQRRAQEGDSHAAAPAPLAAAIPTRDDIPTLAVLPFAEFAVADTDMFADGVVEEITGALSRSHDFRVIARQSVFALRGSGQSVPDMAAKLGAEYVIEGAVRRSGERVRISVQLVQGCDGHTLWSERFDDRLDDLFDLLDRIAAQVAGQIIPNLRAAEIARARTRPPQDRTAYELMLTALPHFWAHRADENQRAIELLDQALAHQPDFAPAMAYKAWCHAHRCCYTWTTDGRPDRAAAADLLARATPLVQDHPAALTALSATSSLALNDFPKARSLVDRALMLDPNNAWGWLRLGWTAVYLGDVDVGMAAFDRYDQLSPLDPFHFNGLFGRSAGYRAIGRYEESIALCEQGLREGTGVTWAYRMLFGTYWLAGNQEAAIDAARKWREAYPTITFEMARDLMPKWQHDPEYVRVLHLLWEVE
ncbi:hypothetical protein Q4577_00165 [Marinovum sp. 2_MG-2023]|uniref:hypothetical protein n=1 Tax=unclassified Marinovum TaxID=2647166 RepID=UPI0026E1659A|nr:MULTISPECIES: hypothetical protein [unclassified Marinovum]MDO6728408.1 hypothetical protein [Marinovum sp. 2_MG-2023]MDO6778176.1 hypothetical protein [Marinovum sp. 1_MG-2023]